jgi:hypothetical protein
MRVEPRAANELVVVHPLAHDELELVLNAGVDEVAEQPALDTVICLAGMYAGP